MVWVKLDDDFYDHPKVARLPPEYMLPCVGLHVLTLCWCNRHLTNGVVPRGQVFRLAGDLAGLLHCSTPEPLINQLIDVGMWEVDEWDSQGHASSYHIHDYLVYQPTKDQVVDQREVARAGHVAGGKARASKALRVGGKFAPNPPAEQPAEQPAEPAGHQQATSPVPVPVPVNKEYKEEEDPPASSLPSPEVAELTALARTVDGWKKSNEDYAFVAVLLEMVKPDQLEQVIRELKAYQLTPGKDHYRNLQKALKNWTVRRAERLSSTPAPKSTGQYIPWVEELYAKKSEEWL